MEDRPLQEIVNSLCQSAPAYGYRTKDDVWLFIQDCFELRRPVANQPMPGAAPVIKTCFEAYYLGNEE